LSIVQRSRGRFDGAAARAGPFNSCGKTRHFGGRQDFRPDAMLLTPVPISEYRDDLAARSIETGARLAAPDSIWKLAKLEK
jgi:hypothetical protein